MEILTELKPLTGRGRFVFPSIRSAARPMSDNTINASLRMMQAWADHLDALRAGVRPVFPPAGSVGSLPAPVSDTAGSVSVSS